MVREETTKELSQKELSPKKEIEQGSKSLERLQGSGENERRFNFKVVREKRGVHIFVHGE